MPNTQEAAFSATKILLPIDFSPTSEAALEAATGLAQQFHAAIHLVHIIPEIPDFNTADFFPETAVLKERKESIEERLADRKVKLVLKGVPTTFSVERGNDVVGTVMRVMKHEHIDMIVISTHGLSGWRPLILGSIAQEVIKQVNCTLLLLQSSNYKSTHEVPAVNGLEEITLTPVAETMKVPSPTLAPHSLAGKQIDQAAEDLAEQGGRTEHEFDQAHLIFTK